ncbi:tRNA pseudouridine synthase, putative [Babesia bigemina]|uniref:tRNA pseudouridine synthase, putative n=1 Tax=Babesia bigemina TaxID=5866 RepID=A0A061D3X0_BABBI|nr:tRNA pseudouridine synthase, putative [Babesia bigemina]CDR94752.1 tRNA pseudouridine synthase, putative [Babesia bigemina]|eukprot:XP_012766938.1 tRNA pseudouridine synthase, putative [Babesia bigemina]
MSRDKRILDGAPDDAAGEPSPKRAREDTESPRENDQALGSNSVDTVSAPRVHVPKTKYAIAFGLVPIVIQSGPGSEHVNTVEGCMLDALFAAGAIHESHRSLIAKLQLSKASRTDKGVHAACTYIGGRFELSHLSSGEPDVSRENALVSKLNELLPGDIRCFQVLRVTRGFCARYEYVFPEWLLRKRYVLDDESKRELFSKLSEQMGGNLQSHDHISCPRIGRGPSNGYDGTTEDRELDLASLESILQAFCGSHDFRNFTPKQKGMENTTQRFIHELKACGAPHRFRYRCCDRDGDGAVLFVQPDSQDDKSGVRSCAIPFTLSKRHVVQTALAPAEGLFLHHPSFDAYNKRCAPPQTPFIEYEDVEAQVEEFKQARLYPEIVSSFEGDVWSTWLTRLVRNPFFLENCDFRVSGEQPTGAKGTAAPGAAAAPDPAAGEEA